MNALLLRNMRRAASLQSFREYRALEAQNPTQSSVTSDGALLEFETLELRLHPPNVVIDNDSYDDMTVITIDSANRPGTLIEVVQCLTELNLSIRKARISSDGGWFVDEFFVTETPKGKVVHPHKLDLIRKVLDVDNDGGMPGPPEALAVFELSGRDQRGLLSAVLNTITSHGCEVQSVAVWTYCNAVAMVVGVADRHTLRPGSMSVGGGLQAAQHHAHASHLAPHAQPHATSPMSRPVGGSTVGLAGVHEPDPTRMDHLTQVLCNLLGGEGSAHVAYEVVVGEIHHERRLHHLLLLEEERCWEAHLSGTPSIASHLSASITGQLSVPGGPNLVSTGGVLTAGGAAGAGVSEAGTANAAGQPLIPSTPTSPAQHGNGTQRGSEPGFAPPSPRQLPPATTAVPGTGPIHPSGASGGAGPACPTVLAGPGDGYPSTANGQVVATPTSSFAAVQLQGGDGGLDSLADIGDPNFDPTHALHLLRADVRIQHSPLLKYYLVTISCKDRNRLFFDTVCTLADMQYDVYHGAIDSDAGQASQLFYVRPRSGEVVLEDSRVRQLSYMLECAVQRRFPLGLRVRLQTPDRGYVPTIFAALSNAGLSVARAEVRSLGDGRSVLDLTLTDGHGRVPASVLVQRACEAAGGSQADDLDPYMAAVAGVGGAAAAAATNALRPGAVYPPTAHLHPHGAHYTSLPPSGLRHASMPVQPAAAVQHPHLAAMHPSAHLAHPSAGAGPGMGVPVPRSSMLGGARFQFAISGSAGRRGPLGHVVSTPAMDGGGGG